MAKKILAGGKESKKAGGDAGAASLAGTPTTTPPQTAPAHPPVPVVVTQLPFRKLPVLIRAFQWFPEMGACGGVVYKARPEAPDADKRAVVETLEGDHEVTPSDWIITGVKGEVYPCKDEIFRMTYEEAKETELADPTKLPATSPRNVTWIVVRFSNGDSFKIPAKAVARAAVKVMTHTPEADVKELTEAIIKEREDKEYARLMRAPAELVKFASEYMGWNELAMVALGYQAPAQTDRPVEWATAFKTVEIEPEPRVEKPVAPPASDLKLAKDEDANAKPGAKDDEDDPEKW